MFDYRFLTLLGTNLIFAALSVVMVMKRGEAVVFFPLYGTLFLWFDFRKDTELPVIFLFLITMVGLMLAWTSGAGARVPFVIEIAGLWVLSWMVAQYRSQGDVEARLLQSEMLALDSSILDDERELKHYQNYQEAANQQIRLRRDLTDSARSLGSTMDAMEVHRRLSSILAARFSGARVDIVPEGSPEPLLEIARHARGPVFIRDSSKDGRLKNSPRPSFRSALAVPLRVMKRPTGFVKLESDQPDTFGTDDVKTVDLFATMAALSLENIKFYEAVQDAATHDPLTQLHSHKAFQSRLQEEVLRSGRSQTPLSVILGDIDHFKSYNDRYGHQAGDHLLRTVASILSSFARPVDMVARYGGEEFALILPSVVRSEAVEAANRIRDRIASEPFVFQGQNTQATMSFGVSNFPQDATTASQIVRVCDERLYRAKSGGRNRVVG